MNIMREENVNEVPEYTKLKPLCRRLEEEGRWKCLEETVPSDRKYYMDYDALVQVYEVL